MGGIERRIDHAFMNRGRLTLRAAKARIQYND